MRRPSLWVLLVLIACGDRSAPGTTSTPPASHAPVEAAAEPAAPAGEADSGHPYTRELIRNLYGAWQVPASDLAGEVIACVKLAPDGSIAARHLEKRAHNEIDRSVEQALRDLPAMGEPVPPELVPLLTERGICARFSVLD